MSQILRSRYRLVVSYVMIVLVSWALRSTPVNSCTVYNDSGICFGQIDFLLLLLSFPGWSAWMILNLLPGLVKLAVLSNLIGFLNILSIEFRAFFIPSSFVLTATMLLVLGYIGEKFFGNNIIEETA